MIQKTSARKRQPGTDPPNSQNEKKTEPARQGSLQIGIRIDDMVFRQFLDSVPDGLVIVNALGEIQFVNKHINEMFGYLPGEILGKPVELLIPERFSDAHKLDRDTFFEHSRSRQMGSGLTLSAARKDQTEFLAEISLNPIKIDAETYILAAVRDVTLQKLSEKRLELSQERYHQILDNMLEGCQIIDFDWRYIYTNAVAASQGHRKPDELFMRTMMDAFPGIENTELFTIIKNCMLERISHHVENRFDNPDGTVGWFELSIQPVPEGIFILSIDITERKQVEVALLESNAQFRTLFEASPDAIVLINPRDNWTILDCNAAACQMNGYTRDELIGQSIDILNLNPGVATERAEYLEQIHRTSILHADTLHRRKDGTIFPVEISTSLIMLGGHEIVLGIDRDISERKRADESLVKSEQRYRTLFEDSPISLWEEDFSAVKLRIEQLRRQGISDFQTYFPAHPEVVIECAGLVRVVDVNKEALRLYRSERKEDLLSGLVEVFDPNTLNHFQEELICVAEGRTEYNWEGQEKTLTGERLDVRITWVVAPGYEQNLSKVIVSIVDITERKQAEEELQTRTDELQTLYELSRDLADADDLDEILAQVNRHAVESVHTTFARVLLLEGDNIVMRSAYPVRFLDQDLMIGRRMPAVVLPYCQSVMEQNQAVILRNNSMEVGSAERTALLLDFAQSLCLIPLWVGRSEPGSRQALGLLILGEARSESREPFTPGKIRLSESIGDQAASAIRRMLLYEQTERRLQHLTALREIDQVVASSFGIELSLRAVLTQVTEQLGVDAATVWLFNPTSNLLEYSAGRGFRTKTFELAHPLRLGEGYAGLSALERRVIHIPNLTELKDNPRLMLALLKEPFISYYCVPLIAKGSVKGVLEVFHRLPLEPDDEWLGFLYTLAGQAAIAIDNATLFENLQRSNTDLIQAYDTTLEGWSAALDLRDKETEGHTQRVTVLTIKLAELMGFNQQELVQVRRGALLHDIGKMGVPDRILHKPDKLTDDEWVIMRMHPTYAYQMLKPIAYLRQALDIPYCHHEKWDGSGYPRGLKGERIPLVARIFAVVDIYDALTSDRPYRKSWTHDKTLEYIRELSGNHLDPQVVAAFLKMVGTEEWNHQEP